MKLLVVTQYFWPETFMINELVSTLRDQGHEVVVATGKPNYPSGRVFDGYQAEGTQREIFDRDIPVVRVPLRPRGTGGLGLFLNYLSFAWSGAVRFPGLLTAFQPDAILMYAPSPILGAIAAIPLKWIKRAHLAVWVQDLWPESLSATGYITNRFSLGLVSVLVRAIYACTDSLLVQSHAFVEPVARLARRDKIIYYPNSTRALPATSDDAVIPAELRRLLDSHFCVVFGGNLGSVQAVPTMVEAARLLRDLPDVRIVLVGDGSMSPWIRQQMQAGELENLVTIDRQPSSVMPAIYHRSGALLVALKDDDVLSYTVPSKVQIYLAAGRPIIAALRGEGARLVLESGAGVACPAEDPAALAACVRDVYHRSVAERTKMGAAGARYFSEHFDMESQATRLTTILTERVRGDRRQH